jgi:hypothetical protein
VLQPYTTFLIWFDRAQHPAVSPPPAYGQPEPSRQLHQRPLSLPPPLAPMGMTRRPVFIHQPLSPTFFAKLLPLPQPIAPTSATCSPYICFTATTAPNFHPHLHLRVADQYLSTTTTTNYFQQLLPSGVDRVVVADLYLPRVLFYRIIVALPTLPGTPGSLLNLRTHEIQARTRWWVGIWRAPEGGACFLYHLILPLGNEQLS